MVFLCTHLNAAQTDLRVNTDRNRNEMDELNEKKCLKTRKCSTAAVTFVVAV